MKPLLFILSALLCSVSLHAQEAVFSYSAQGEIISKAKFIESFENQDRDDLTPYTLKHSETMSTHSGEKYTIKYLKYHGWEEEIGDYNVIEIYQHDKLIFSQRNDCGWIYFPNPWRGLSPFKGGYFVYLKNDAIALIVQGATIMSQPPVLTIIVMKGDDAKLVYNRSGEIEERTDSSHSTVFKLLTNTVEWVEDGPLNEPIYNYLILQNRMLYLRE